jgi:hypothetical protein
MSRPVLWSVQPPIQWVPGALSLRVKRQRREADHSPPSSPEVKECVELCFHSPNTSSWSVAKLSTGTTLPLAFHVGCILSKIIYLWHDVHVLLYLVFVIYLLLCPYTVCQVSMAALPNFSLNILKTFVISFCVWTKESKVKKVEVIYIYCLIKYHAKKKNWGSGGIASRARLGNGWRWLVSFMSKPLYPRRRKIPSTHGIAGWVGPKSGLNAVAERKIRIIVPAGNWTLGSFQKSGDIFT